MTRVTDQMRLADDYVVFPCGCESATVMVGPVPTFVYRPHAADCQWYAYVESQLAERGKPVVQLAEKPAPGCLECGERNDDFTPINTDHKPAAGAISICANCGHLAMFTGDGLTVRQLSADELAQVRADPEVAAAQRAIGRPSWR